MTLEDRAQRIQHHLGMALQYVRVAEWEARELPDASELRAPLQELREDIQQTSREVAWFLRRARGLDPPGPGRRRPLDDNKDYENQGPG